MEWPRISIVTPVFNQVQYLEQTILSVIGQKYPNLEYVIIDGGSSDGTLDIIKKYEKHLTRWVSEKDNGMYDALQKGFAGTTGEIMLWINSDDILHAGAFETIVEVFSSFPQIDWITGLNTIIDEQGRLSRAYPARRFSKYHFLTFDFQYIQQESTVWRRSLWERAGGRLETSSRLAADFELWLRFIHLTQLYTCNLLIGGFRRRKDQLSFVFARQYVDEANAFIRTARTNLAGKEKNKIRTLAIIRRLRKLLKYSIVLDLGIFDRTMNRIEKRIHSVPAIVERDWDTQKLILLP
ncbi:MAG TPA: glycosyltransferase [Cyclobacteriaceae bacterium]|nr:glycosyltransferase [Cyclobacteriaceae bacterium]